MWKTFWYMAKLAIVITGSLWLLSLEGDIVFQWDAYKVTAHTGFVLFIIAAFVLVVTIVTRGAIFVESLPKIMKLYNAGKRREKGHVAILRSLTALSAGDAKIAAYQAQRAQKLSPAEDGLAQLLGAHAARMSGQVNDAEERFEALSQHKETSLLGYQGLIKTAYEQGEEQKALSLAYQAYDKNTKNKDFLPRIYDMELESRSWNAALKTLRKIEKFAALPKDKIKSDRAALVTQIGLEAKRGGQYAQAADQFRAALKLSNGFLPASLELAEYFVKQKQTGKARRVIEAQWRVQPHPQLAKIWMSMLAERKQNKPDARLEWIKRLCDNNIAHSESKIALAKVAMEDGLWGVARDYLLKVEADTPSAAVYRMLEEIAHCSDHDNDKARIWADKGIDAPSDPVWMCEATGRIYPEWQIMSTPQNFNTIIWRGPRRLQISGISSPYGGASNTLNLVEFMDN
tara:strand:+ start:62585 stop:63958 length:1374 start_codon:yes stop_codon:yes gene_type:complete